MRRGGIGLLLLLLLLLLAAGCSGTGTVVLDKEPTLGDDADLMRLTGWMTGAFSSERQSQEDERFFDIRLHVARIWPERDDAVWLYVEQAAATALERPYRQRVYRLTRISDEVLESRIFELAEPETYAGAWSNPETLQATAPEELTYRTGCEVLLKFTGEARDRVVGGTLGNLCKSELRGASYATTRVEIDGAGMVSWDQGFDAEDSQVWGSEVGGYRFLRTGS